MRCQNPVVVIPGITASRLHDRYDVPPETVWSALRRGYERVALHPDDLRYERREPARVSAEGVFAIPYREFITDLRHDLSPAPGKPTPVYGFEYDWRQPLKRTEDRLAQFVLEVIDRTMLLKHYDDAWRADPKVDLVGHSMGGLIIAGYLAAQGAHARVGKVITMGAPFRGSLEAPLKITTGLANFGEDAQSASEREAARMTPALYHLLPDFAGAVDVDAGLPTSLFDAGLWQRSVAATIARYVRDCSRDQRDPRGQAERLFGSLLNEGKRHRERVSRLALGDAGLSESDWLCVVGVGARTRVRLRIQSDGVGPVFDLASGGRMDEIGNADPSIRVLTGDGTVPFLGALPPFLGSERVVCVTPDDFGYWEVGDKLLRKAAGFHGMLPKMNLVNRMAAAFLTGKKRRGAWGRPAPGLDDPRDWAPPVPGIERKAWDRSEVSRAQD